jgi:hypothetical protein
MTEFPDEVQDGIIAHPKAIHSQKSACVAGSDSG